MTTRTAVTRRPSKLFVLWRAPEALGGTRHVVGFLSRDDGGYSYEYADDLTSAEAQGFQVLPEFPDTCRAYRARHLFATFAQRIPAPSRPDYRSILASWHVEDADDLMEILAKSGGVQVTDRIELAE